jgi:hypothetical protein
MLACTGTSYRIECSFTLTSLLQLDREGYDFLEFSYVSVVPANSMIEASLYLPEM